METKFKVGDIVYDSVNYPDKNGKIINNNEGELFPILVKFEKETERDRYTSDGRFNEDATPTLSFTPYELKGFTQERPWQPKEGEWIAVKHYQNDYWILRVFDHMNKNIFVCNESIGWQFAKPLTVFITENNKLK